MTTASPVETGTPWTASDESFGARLALVRQHMAWGNVKEAAVACGIPAESWRSWERDGVMPQGSRYFALCAQIAATSGCDYGWLVDRRPSGGSKPNVGKLRPNLTAIVGLGRRTPRISPLLTTV